MQNPVNFLLEFFQKFEEGKLFLPAGSHAHKIGTKAAPIQVWFSEVNSGHLPVCNGNVNRYGVTMLDDGFVFYADIVSDTVEIAWQAVLQSKV